MSNDASSAVGRIPSGVYILTAGCNGRTTGMVASWIQQAGFDPLMITMAIKKDRYLSEWIAESGKFTLNQIAAADKHILKHFGKGFEPEEDAFNGVALREYRPDGPILQEAIAFLVVEVAGSIDGGDHRVLLGRVIDGGRFDHEAEPMIHLRKSGLHY